MRTPKAVVSIRGLTKAFVKRRFFRKGVAFYALDGIDLDVWEGERLSIIGESGSGKTTLARIAAALDCPTSGEVFWFGKPVSKMDKREFLKVRPKVQYIHQNPYASLNPSRTIFDILADPLRRFGKGDNLKERVAELLRMVGIVPPEYFFGKYPRHLSGGGLQRLAVARAMIPEPKVIFADEIVSMIDMSFRAAVVKLLRDLNERTHVTIIMISHDIGVARFFSYGGGRIVVLLRGSIAEIAPSEDLLKNPMHPYTRALVLASPVASTELAMKKRKLLPKYNIQKEAWETEILTLKGCKYAPFCPFAEKICWEKKPKAVKVGENHLVTCHCVEKLPEWELKGEL